MPKKYDVINQKSEEAPQCPEDQLAPAYSNETPESWITGKNEDATTKPGFDRSNPAQR